MLIVKEIFLGFSSLQFPVAAIKQITICSHSIGYKPLSLPALIFHHTHRHSSSKPLNKKSFWTNISNYKTTLDLNSSPQSSGYIFYARFPKRPLPKSSPKPFTLTKSPKIRYILTQTLSKTQSTVARTTYSKKRSRLARVRREFITFSPVRLSRAGLALDSTTAAYERRKRVWSWKGRPGKTGGVAVRASSRPLLSASSRYKRCIQRGAVCADPRQARSFYFPALLAAVMGGCVCRASLSMCIHACRCRGALVTGLDTRGAI